LSILLAILIVVTVLYLLAGHRVAGGRYRATNPMVIVSLWFGVIALTFYVAATVLGSVVDR
jgi:hypothetical protein